MFIATCTERELRKRKKRKFSLWVRQCSSTGFIIQVRPGRVGLRAPRAASLLLTYPFHCVSPRCSTEAGAGPPPPPWDPGWPALSPSHSSLSREITAVKTLTSTQALAVLAGGFTETVVTGGDHLPESTLCGSPRPAAAPHLLPASAHTRHMGAYFIRGD